MAIRRLALLAGFAILVALFWGMLGTAIADTWQNEYLHNGTGVTATNLEKWLEGDVKISGWLSSKFSSFSYAYNLTGNYTKLKWSTGTVADSQSTTACFRTDKKKIKHKYLPRWTYSVGDSVVAGPGLSHDFLYNDLTPLSVTRFTVSNTATDGDTLTIDSIQVAKVPAAFSINRLFWDSLSSVSWDTTQTAKTLVLNDSINFGGDTLATLTGAIVYRAKLHLNSDTTNIVRYVGQYSPPSTEVPRGGVDIDLGSGGNTVQLSLTNKTGEGAEDVTVTIYNASAVPNITEMNDPNQATADDVDDNNNGIDEGVAQNEDDNTDSSPGTTCRLIFTNYSVADNGALALDLTFSGNTPAGTKLKVRFSNKSTGNKHYDLCAVGVIDADRSATVGIPIGSHLVNIGAINSTGSTADSIIRLYFEPSGANFNDSIVSVMVESAYPGNTVTREGPTVRKINLKSTVPNGNTVLLNVLVVTDTTGVNDNNSKITVRTTAPGTTPTPFLGTRGIVVLLLLLAATAWFVLSRRKVRTTGSAA